jgi:arylsulfatase A-like enzyme
LPDDRKLLAVKAEEDYYCSTAIADHAVRCLREHAAQHGKAPFFQYVCFTAPHFPLQAPARDIARYQARYLEGWDIVREQRWSRPRALGIVEHPLSLLEREIGPPYPFPEALERLGSGWSSAANTPSRRHKTWVHEGGIATPLIVHWPAGIAGRGELRRAPGHVVDLAPTLKDGVSPIG